jgi:DNA/RNA endonuclease G (NUC1)
MQLAPRPFALRLVVQVTAILAFGFGLAHAVALMGDDDAPIDLLEDSAPDDWYVRRGNVLIGCADLTALSRWQLWETTIAGIDGPGDRDKSHWKKDPEATPVRVADESDYLKSGKSKGHGSPAGDNCNTQKAMDWCHYYSNSRPQDQPMNAQIWERVEERRRQLSKSGVQVRSVVVGIFKLQPDGESEGGCPLWKLKVTAQGPHQLWIPTHFATSIRCRRGENEWLENYTIPNTPDVAGEDIKDYRCSCRAIEIASNTNLWPAPKRLKGVARVRYDVQQEALELKE